MSGGSTSDPEKLFRPVKPAKNAHEEELMGRARNQNYVARLGRVHRDGGVARVQILDTVKSADTLCHIKLSILSES